MKTRVLSLDLPATIVVATDFAMVCLFRSYQQDMHDKESAKNRLLLNSLKR